MASVLHSRVLHPGVLEGLLRCKTGRWVSDKKVIDEVFARFGNVSKTVLRELELGLRESDTADRNGM